MVEIGVTFGAKHCLRLDKHNRRRNDLFVGESTPHIEETKMTVELKFENVTRTYNGGTGCACGCTGSYTDVEGNSKEMMTAKKRLNFINKNLHRVAALHWEDESCYEVENESGTRVTRVYVKAGA
jgi:hypothetical protein